MNSSFLLLSEFLTVLFAHIAVGIFAMPLKYSKRVSVLVWGCWGLVQFVLLSVTSRVTLPWGLTFLISFFSTYIGQYLLFFILSEGRVIEKLFIMLTYSNFFCIYMGAITALIGSFPSSPPLVSVIMRFLLLGAIVLFFLKELCPMYRESANKIKKGMWSLIFANIIFLLAIVSLSVYPIKLTSITAPQFLPFVLLSAVVLAVYPVFFRSIEHMAALAHEKSERLNADLLAAQVASQEREVAAAKQMRHDLRHHNQQILALLEAEEYAALREYLIASTEQIDSSKLLRFCENETVNNVLRVYAKKAQESNIKMDIVALAEKDLPIASNDIVTILANIVENAYNGARASKQNEPYISVSISRKHGRFIIRCKNACKSSLTFEDEMPDDLRGIGVSSITSAVNKYGGNCRFTAKNGEFSCVVIIEI